jgi:hypothetical protein
MGTTNDFYVEIEYSLNGSDHTACKAVGDYWTRGFNASGDGFVFEPGKAYEFNILIGDGQGPRFVGLDVNEVAGWETNPGIEVPRPPFEYRWAGSNIYFMPDEANGFIGSLTFDESHGAKEGYQGLFFKWGSLVGVAASTEIVNYFTGDTYLYIPAIATGKYYKVKVSDVTTGYTNPNADMQSAVLALRSKLLIDADMTTGGNTDFDKIPYVTTGSTDNRSVNYLATSAHTPANYQGDICKYLSAAAIKDNSKLTKSWVMPVSNDFGDASHTLPYEDANYAWNFVSTSITPSSADGGPATLSQLAYTIVATGEQLYFPASGCRYTDAGQLLYVGLYGYNWSGSVSNETRAYYLSFYAGTVNPVAYRSRGYAHSVRCVRE